MSRSDEPRYRGKHMENHGALITVEGITFTVAQIEKMVIAAIDACDNSPTYLQPSIALRNVTNVIVEARQCQVDQNQTSQKIVKDAKGEDGFHL